MTIVADILLAIGRALLATGRRREVSGPFGVVMTLYAAAIAGWTVWAAAFASIDVLALTVIFLSFMLVLVFIQVTARPSASTTRPPLVDWGLAGLSLATGIFFISHIPVIEVRISLLDPLSPIELFFGCLIVLLTLEATRRTVGLGLMVIASLFIAYNLFGHHFEGVLSHGEIDLDHFIDISVFTTDGLFGVPLRVAATYAFLFVLFGTLLEKARGGEFFFNLSALVAGRTIGGPAKVAVVSSALFGTVSGSPTADVVTTGSITIPLMRRVGFNRTLAAATEVAASTGGSILPPVMGSVAFIMAEYTGIPYASIIVAALVPALLYYLGVLTQVHLRCARLGLGAMNRDEIPSLRTTMKQAWLFVLPLCAMVVPLTQGYSPTYVALFGAAAIVVCSQFSSHGRLTPRRLVEGLAETTNRMVGVTGACAAAGLVIGGITMTGLATKVSQLILFLAGGAQFMTLVFTALITIVLGMGMPTPSAYVLAAVLVAPTLVDILDIPLMNAHLFILYYAVLSALTPPVAVAAYAASAISGGNPVSIAAAASRLALVAFIMPFAFIYNPHLILAGETWQVVIEIVQAIGATFAVAMAAEGFLKRPLSASCRVLLLTAGLALLAPTGWITLAALAVLAVAVALALMPAVSPAAGVRHPIVGAEGANSMEDRS